MKIKSFTVEMVLSTSDELLSLSSSWANMQVVLLDEQRRQRVVVEKEVGLVDEAHVRSLFP